MAQISYEQMQENLKLREGENLQDLLSLYDAQYRYGISRNTLRDAAILDKVSHQWLGGLTKRSLYIKRSDIIKYISLSQKRSKSKRKVSWRTPTPKTTELEAEASA